MTEERAKVVRRDCRWVMQAQDRWWCKLRAVERPQDGPLELVEGCPADCLDYQHAPWRVTAWDDEA